MPPEGGSWGGRKGSLFCDFFDFKVCLRMSGERLPEWGGGVGGFPVLRFPHFNFWLKMALGGGGFLRGLSGQGPFLEYFENVI